MTISVIKFKVAALLAFAMLVAQTVDAQENPHWNKSTCQTCHVNASPVEGNIALNAGDAEALCDSCHGDRGDAVPCRHNSDLADGGLGIPDNLRAAMKSERIVCTTCHDISYQCEHPTVQYSFHNPGFLRDRKSRNEGQYCFECHETSSYQKLNAHAVIAGEPPQATCRLCHDEQPAVDETGELRVAFNMRHDLNDTCRGCHNVRPHPRGMSFTPQDESWNHLVVPPDDIRQNMENAFAQTGTRLPLDPQSGEIFCGTCHNPHRFRTGDDDAPTQNVIESRLRQDNICQACHDK